MPEGPAMRAQFRFVCVAASTSMALASQSGSALAQTRTELSEITIEGAAVRNGGTARNAAAGTSVGERFGGVSVVPPALAGPKEGGGKGPVDGLVANYSTAGTKTATSILETPQSVTVIGQDRIETFQGATANDAFKYTPGITADVYGADSRSDNYLTIRGLPANFFQDNLRLPLTRPYGSYRVDPFFAERVEVLRGPASIIYGQGFPGGTVNYVSKRPYPVEFTTVEAQAGNFVQPRLAFDKGGVLSQDGTLSYRLVGLGSINQLNGGNPYEGGRLALAPSVAWRPDSQTSLILFASFLRDDTHIDSDFLPASGTVLQNPNGRISRNLWTGDRSYDKYIKSQFSIGYEFEHRFDEALAVRQNVRYAGVESNINTVYGAGTNFADPSLRTINRYAIGGQVGARTLNVDNQAQADFQIGPTRHTVLFGIDYLNQIAFDKQDFRFAGTLDVFSGVGQPIPAQPVLRARGEDQTIGQTGIYFQDQIRIYDRFILTGGLRYDVATSDFTDVQVFGSNAAKSDDTAVSPRIGATYLFDNGLAPYVSYAKSFSVNPGSASTLFPGSAPGTPFAPSIGEQREAGLKYQPPGTPLLLSAAAFDITQTNVVTTFNLTSYAEDQRSRGFEMEALLQFENGFRVIGAYTLQDVRITRSESYPGDVGGRPVAVPDRVGQLYVDYTFQSGELKGLRLGGGIRYNGGSVGVSDPTAPLKVPDFTLFDASAGYSIDNWRLSLNVFNIADKKYVAACGDPTACFYGQARRYVLGARYTW